MVRADPDAVGPLAHALAGNAPLIAVDASAQVRAHGQRDHAGIHQLLPGIKAAKIGFHADIVRLKGVKADDAPRLTEQ